MSKLEFESIEECSKFLEGETFIYNDAECVILSDAEECYVLGYKKAIEKACEWLESVNLDWYQIREGIFSTQLIEDFRKVMED